MTASVSADNAINPCYDRDEYCPYPSYSECIQMFRRYEKRQERLEKKRQADKEARMREKAHRAKLKERHKLKKEKEFVAKIKRIRQIQR